MSTTPPAPPTTPFPEALKSDYQRFVDEMQKLYSALLKHFHAPLAVYAPTDTPSIQPQVRLAELIDLRVACERQIAHMESVLIELRANSAAWEAAQPQAAPAHPVPPAKKKKKAA